MSKKQKDLAYYKKYVTIDLWVLLIILIFPVISLFVGGISLDRALNTTGLFSMIFSSLGLASTLLTLGKLVLFIVCLVLVKKEHASSGILNIILSVLFLINTDIISILMGIIHLINSVGYQKHLSAKVCD